MPISTTTKPVSLPSSTTSHTTSTLVSTPVPEALNNLKKRKAPTTSPSALPSNERPSRKRRLSPKAKALGLTAEEWDMLNPTLLKKRLKHLARRLAQQVDDDWHDGWEYQAETCDEWLGEVHSILKSVIDIGIKKQLALEQCNDALMIIGDSYRDLLANPSRVPVKEMFNEDVWERISLTFPWSKTPINFAGCFESCGINHLLSVVWKYLLRIVANSEGSNSHSQHEIYLMIKDAHDNGIQFVEDNDMKGHSYDKPESDEEEEQQEEDKEEEEEEEQTQKLEEPDGSNLALHVEEDFRWKDERCRIRTFGRRKCTDRRSSGSPDRRTCA